MSAATLAITRDAPLETWFGVGGRADRYAEPRTVEDLRALLAEHDPETGPVRVIGDGANLLVADDGADGLVLSLAAMNSAKWTETGLTAGAGALLPRLVVESVRQGLAGLEGLGGVPASLGGALRMNAGGAFGEIGPAVKAVRVLDPAGRQHRLEPPELGFGYRRSNLAGLIVVEAELALAPEAPEPLRDRLKEVMAHKKEAQPLGDRSAGCVFKNPEVGGERVSAGRLIDKAGLKGERAGGATVSERHGNFITVEPGATAADVLTLIDRVRARVASETGVELERELVVWRRGEGADHDQR